MHKETEGKVPDGLVKYLNIVKASNKANSIGPMYTDETDLLLTTQDFARKLGTNPYGTIYFYIFMEFGIQLKLNNLYQIEKIDNDTYLLIPEWDLLLTAIDMYSNLTRKISTSTVEKVTKKKEE